MMAPNPIKRGQAGVVLPVVLVMLLVFTTLVLTQVRRGTVDERLAGNTSRVIAGDTMAQSVLRYCEAELQNDPRLWDGVVLASAYTATPAYKSNIPANSKLTMGASLVPPGATTASCVIEDATDELGCSRTQTQTQAGAAGCRNPYFRKYRVTSSVVVPDATAFGARTFLSQSELRLSVF